MQLACVPMKIRERDGGARVCRGRRGASERASFLLRAAISHGSSCFGFSCDCRVAVIDAGFSPLPPPPRFPSLYPSLSLSYSSLSCLPLKKKKRKKAKGGGEKKKKEKQATLEFKGRRFKLAGKLLVTAIFLERGVAFNWKLVLQSLQLTRSSFHSTSLLSRRIVETGSRFVRDSWHFVAASVTSCESSVQLFDCPFTFILSVLIFHLRFEFDQVYCLFSSYYYLTIDFIIAFIYIRTRMRIILITHPTVLLNIKLKI